MSGTLVHWRSGPLWLLTSETKRPRVHEGIVVVPSRNKDRGPRTDATHPLGHPAAPLLNVRSPTIPVIGR